MANQATQTLTDAVGAHTTSFIQRIADVAAAIRGQAIDAAAVKAALDAQAVLVSEALDAAQSGESLIG